MCDPYCVRLSVSNAPEKTKNNYPEDYGLSSSSASSGTPTYFGVWIIIEMNQILIKYKRFIERAIKKNQALKLRKCQLCLGRWGWTATTNYSGTARMLVERAPWHPSFSAENSRISPFSLSRITEHDMSIACRDQWSTVRWNPEPLIPEPSLGRLFLSTECRTVRHGHYPQIVGDPSWAWAERKDSPRE